MEVAAGLFLLYFLFDASLFIRSVLATVVGYIRRRFKPKQLLEVSVKREICLTSDLDVFLHMNNARYPRECDVARIKFWTENYGWDTIKQLGGFMVAGAQNIRYRKSLDLFTTFTIHTKIVYWDDTAFYVEQLFVRSRDQFVCCINMVKQTLVGTTPDRVVEELVGKVDRPQPLPELVSWIEATRASSDRLRAA